MHPIIERDVMHARIADLHRQAERDRIARAASLTPRTRQESAGRTACSVARPFSRAARSPVSARLSQLC
jgi:hypothetical protein